MVTRSCLMIAMLLGLLVLTPETQAQDSEMISKLTGTWVGDAEKTRKLLKDMEKDATEIDQVVNEIGNVKMTLDKEGTFKVEMKEIPEPLSGTWKKKSEDKEKKEVVITMVLKFGDQEQPMDFTFTLMEDNVVKLQPTDELPAIFNREVK